MTIEFAMITAPREVPTSEDTVKSLLQAGYTGQLTVFAEPEAKLPACTKVYRNETKLGAFENHHQALQYLVNYSKCDLICVLLDDTEFSKNTIDKVITLFQSVDESMAVSLVTIEQDIPHNERTKSGWVFSNPGIDAWGGSYVLRKKVAEEIITNPYYLNWLNRLDDTYKPMDGIICQTLKNINHNCAFHIPSLCDHIGEHSTLSHGQLTKNRRGYKFNVNGALPAIRINKADKNIELLVNDINIRNEISGNGKFYESPMLDAIRSMELRGTFIDVGANVGNHSIYFDLFCGVDVIAFEPDMENFDYLLYNKDYNGCKNITTVNAAVSYKSGWCNTLTPEINKKGTTLISEGEGNVPVVTIDEFHKPNISLIKIDVEGGELNVLSGAKITIENDKPEIFIEIWNERNLEIAKKMLANYGYKLIQRYNHAPTYHFSTRDLPVLFK